MKWIRLVLWKLQSRHGSVHRRMDRQTDGQTSGQMDRPMDNVKPVYSPFNFVEAGGIITYQFSNFKVQQLKFGNGISNFIPHFTGHVITYTYWDCKRNPWQHKVYCVFQSFLDAKTEKGGKIHSRVRQESVYLTVSTMVADDLATQVRSQVFSNHIMLSGFQLPVPPQN